MFFYVFLFCVDINGKIFDHM